MDSYTFTKEEVELLREALDVLSAKCILKSLERTREGRAASEKWACCIDLRGKLKRRELVSKDTTNT